MALIKNAVLKPLQQLLGIAPGTQPTDVDLGNVSLTLPITDSIVRRSSQLVIPHGGWFQGILENVHSAADDEISAMPVYSPPAADVVAPFPSPVGPEWDVWLIGVSGRRSSGSGGLTGATASITPSSASPFQQAWGRDDSAAPVVGTARMVLAQFDAISTITAALTAADDPMITEQGLTYQPINMRLPRGCTLAFHSTSAAAAEFQMMFILGLFSAGLGQDVAT